MMRTYLKRLRAHPGVLPATGMTAMFLLAGLTNEQPTTGVIAGAVASLSTWLIVLITARTQPLPREEHPND